MTKLSDKETGDQLKVGLVLEELAMAAVCPLITPQDLTELEDISRAMTAAIEHKSYFEISRADLAFHRRIWVMTGNPLLERTLHSISMPLFDFLGVFHKSRLINPADAQPHDELIRALATRDPDTTRLAIREHILLSHSTIFSEVEKP